MRKTDALDTTTYITRREVAAFLRVSQATLHRWMKERIGPPFVRFVEDGRGRVLYPRLDVEAYAASRTVYPKTMTPEAPAARRAGKAAR